MTGNMILTQDQIRKEIARPMLEAVRADIAAAQLIANRSGRTIKLTFGMMAVTIKPEGRP